jgi:hypothetical protein
VFPFSLVIAALSGWLQREQDSVIAFLREENRVLKARLDDDEPRPLVSRSIRKLGRHIAYSQPVVPLQMLIAALLEWLEREQRDVIEFLREENRTLKAQLSGPDCS